MGEHLYNLQELISIDLFSNPIKVLLRAHGQMPLLQQPCGWVLFYFVHVAVVVVGLLEIIVFLM